MPWLYFDNQGHALYIQGHNRRMELLMGSSQIRSASLTNYAEVARAVGLDPFAQLRAAGLDVQCLNNPDLKIPDVPPGDRGSKGKAMEDKKKP